MDISGARLPFMMQPPSANSKVYMAEVAIVILIVFLIAGIIFDIWKEQIKKIVFKKKREATHPVDEDEGKEAQGPFDNEEDTFIFLQEVRLTQSDRDRLTQKEEYLILDIQQFDYADITDFVNYTKDTDPAIEDDRQIKKEILALANKIKIAQRTFIRRIFALCKRYKLATINTCILLIPYIAFNVHCISPACKIRYLLNSRHWSQQRKKK